MRSPGRRATAAPFIRLRSDPAFVKASGGNELIRAESKQPVEKGDPSRVPCPSQINDFFSPEGC